MEPLKLTAEILAPVLASFLLMNGWAGIIFLYLPRRVVAATVPSGGRR